MKCNPQTRPDSLRTENLNIQTLIPLASPRALKAEFPAPEAVLRNVIGVRQAIGRILEGTDRRLLVVSGPCSIHDPTAALEYAHRLNGLRRELEDDMLILMRVYFEKPRTTIGWKGLIYDPHMDGSADIAHGIRTARRLLLDINTLGLPTATEMLDPIMPQYTADLISWAAIGARTAESQTHRQMASGLSMPIGFKNGTDGNVQIAVDAMESARHPHSFLGIDEDGHIAIVRTRGTPWGHLILRGSATGSNYDADSIRSACQRMEARKLRPAVMIDCSHGNAGKKFAVQETVWNDVLAQRAAGNTAIIGMLVESNLHEGNQPIPTKIANLRYGISVTDECINWETTERMLRLGALAAEGHRRG